MSELVTRRRLLPVVVIEDPAGATRLADALVEGGLPVAEVTFRTPAASQALAAMAADGRMTVGAGTIIHPDQVDAAVAAGATFVVSPGFSAAVARRCATLGVPLFPGVANATDIIAALDEGLTVLKFFPAEQLGGLPMLSALAAPFPQVRFIPTGGIAADQARSYLAHPKVVAIGGSWMVPPKLIGAGDWTSITRLTAEAVALAAGERETGE